MSASGILLDERRRVLVIQRRDNGNWEPPGGLLELDESIVHCLRREMREETGLSVAPVRLTGVYKNMRIGAVALVFRVRRLGGTLVTTDETADFAWWTEDDVRGKMREVYAARVLDALDAADPSVRAHDGVGLLAEDVPIEDPDRRQPTLD